jgi:hypothetical protein
MLPCASREAVLQTAAPPPETSLPPMLWICALENRTAEHPRCLGQNMWLSRLGLGKPVQHGRYAARAVWFARMRSTSQADDRRFAELSIYGARRKEPAQKAFLLGRLQRDERSGRLQQDERSS